LAEIMAQPAGRSKGGPGTAQAACIILGFVLLEAISNFRPQEGCMTDINPHRSRGPWNAPQQHVAGRVERWI
jgi:hypothetical protein